MTYPKTVIIPKKPVKIPFTALAYQEMLDKLTELAQLEKETLVRLQAAREMGDLSENGMYKYAKMELGDIRRKMRHLKRLVDNGYALEKHTATDDKNAKIELGCLVVLSSSDTKLEFTLVNEHESNPSLKKLSYKSPIGSAVFGKKKGDKVSVFTPAGVKEYLVIDVK